MFMALWTKIGLTFILVVLLPIILLTYGNGIAEDFHFRVPGLGLIISITILIVTRFIWRKKNIIDQDESNSGNL
jgi:hypothetical protein